VNNAVSRGADGDLDASSSLSAHQAPDRGSGSSPSLADYDEAVYGGADAIHSDALVPRLERSINALIVKSAVLVIDKLYEGRDYPRFYALETVARVPYFSFLSVLHLYETLGFWRRADYLKVHFAQTMNEFHHLLIMEAMGGDKKFADRFFAQHMAVAYYGMTCLVYLASPRMAYNLSEQVEAHAYHTYDEFLKRNESELKEKKPPAIARKYYAEGDLFLFDEFQTGDPTAKSAACAERRRPVIENLYDVFLNVRNDEAEHMKTMQFCQLPGTILRAPSESACVVGDGESNNAQSATNDDDDDDGTDAARTCEGLVDCVIRAQDEPTWQAERDGGEEP
jgi:ubiquinol oxidase